MNHSQQDGRRRRAGFVLDLLDHVIGNPVREGGLLARDWPPGLAGISLVAAIGYVAIGTVVLASPLLRRFGTLVSANGDQTVPDVALPILFSATLLALSLVQTAALHGHWLGRLLVFSLTVTVMLQSAGLQTGAARWLSVAAAFALAALVVLRWRRSFRQWEFLAVVGCTIVGILAPLWWGARAASVIGFDQRSLNTVLLVGSVTIFAYPTIMLSGAALTEVAVSTAGWFTALVRGRLRGPAWAAFVAVIVVGRPAEVGWSMLSGDDVFAPRAIANSAIPVALVLLLVATVVRPHRRGEPLSFATDLTETWKSLIVPVAIGFTVFVLPMYMATVLQGVATVTGSGGLAVAVSVLALLFAPQTMAVARLLVVVAAVVIAARRARTGAVTAPIVLVSIAGISLPGIVAALSGGRIRAPWSLEGVGVVLSVLSIAVWLVLLLRRRVTAGRIVHLVLLNAVLIAVDQRGIVGDPLGAVIGMSAVGAALFGVLWRVLTDAGYTRGDSAAFPRASRVLFFWGNGIVTVTSLALVSLTRTSGGSVDPTPFAGLGDFLLGTALVMAVGISALLAALGAGSDSGRVPGSQQRDYGGEYRERRIAEGQLHQ